MVYQKKKKKERERERSNSNHYQAERPMIAGQWVWVCRACPGQRIAHDLSRGPFLFSLVVAVLRSRDRVLAFFFFFFLVFFDHSRDILHPASPFIGPLSRELSVCSGATGPRGSVTFGSEVFPSSLYFVRITEATWRNSWWGIGL
jgi:hypothetical protein